MPNDYDTLWDRIQEAQAPNSTTSDEEKENLGWEILAFSCYMLNNEATASPNELYLYDLLKGTKGR